MALVKRTRHTDLEPVQPAPSGSLDEFRTVPAQEWLEARPPATSPIGEYWASFITPFRRACLGFMWITWSWVRFSVALSVVLALVVIPLIKAWS